MRKTTPYPQSKSTWKQVQEAIRRAQYEVLKAEADRRQADENFINSVRQKGTLREEHRTLCSN